MRHRLRARGRRRFFSVAPPVETLERRLFLSAAPIGPEFPVNQTTLNNQSAAAVAADGDGDYVVAWESDQGGAGFDVYARRYNAAGVAQGGEFRVNTFTAGAQRAPTAAIDADGDFVIAWQSLGQDAVNTEGVYAQRYNAAGVAQGKEFRVNATTADSQTAPTVATDAAGNFVVAWQGVDGSSSGIFAQRYNFDGAAQGGEFVVNSFTTNGQLRPAAAMDAAGNFLIAWDSVLQDGSSFGIYAKRYNAAGVALPPPAGVPPGAGTEFRVNTATTNSQVIPAAAMDASGDFVVAWESSGQDGSGYGVYAQRYTAAGAAQGTEFRVNTATTNNQSFPALTSDADGDFVVTWQSDGQDGSLYGVYGQRYSAAGAAQGTEFRVNTATTNSQFGSAAATDAAGDFVVAWTSIAQDSGSTQGVYAQRYDETTDTAGPVVASVAAGGTRVTPGAVVKSPVTQAVVTFSENLSTVGGTTGANSVTNPANWSLSYNGQNVPGAITAVAFVLDAATSKYAATLTLSAELADGSYVLAAKQAIGDIAGNALDGNFDGTPGGDFSVAFAVRRLAPIGPEFRVNTFTNRDQQNPVVAIDAAGDFVVAWQSYGQDGQPTLSYSVYAQRYDAAGTRRGGEFHVDTTTVADQRSPAVAMNAAVGYFIIVWDGHGAQDSSNGIYAQRYDAAGVARGAEFSVNTTTANIQRDAAVAMDADGDFVVAWESNLQDGSLSGVYAQRYNAAGAAQGGEFRVNTVTADSQRSPVVAMDAAGDFVVAWASHDTSGSYGVYAQRYDAAGVARGGEFRVNTATANNQSSPAAAMDADGNFVVAWTSFGQDTSDSNGVYAQRYSATGAARGVEFRVNTTTADNQILPTVATDANGDFVIAWQSRYQDGSGDGVYAQRYDASGAPRGTEFQVNTTTANSQRNPAVATNADGRLVVAWQSRDQDGSGEGVYAQRYAANEAPTTLGIGSANGVENGSFPPVNLAAVFADSTTPASALAYTIAANTNPGLFGSTPIASGGLTLNPAANAAGMATITIRATDAGGLFVDATFPVTVRPPWLTVPSGGGWSITGTPTAYTLSLTSGGFTIPSDPAALNPNLNVSVASPATLTINADVHIAGLTLTGLGAAVTFNGPTGGGLSFTGGSVPVAVPVPADPTPPPLPVPRGAPILTVADVSRAEGRAGLTAFAFAVTLDHPGDKTIRVWYSTANKTAAKGADYLATAGTLVFKPGETRKVVTVWVKGDTAKEADETFFLNLFGPVNATIGHGRGKGVIRSDD